MPSYLLRVQLLDRPGSLGSLAVALGSVGADILSLDVVERVSGCAIDDLVVDLPRGAMPDMLITAAEAINGVRVDSIRPHTGLLEAHRELELIDHIAAGADKATKLNVLAYEAPRVLRVGWCTVVRLQDHGLERVVGSRGAPETAAESAPWLPLEQAAALDGAADWVPQVWREMDTTLAAAPLGEPTTAVMLGRPGGPDFRPQRWPGWDTSRASPRPYCAEIELCGGHPGICWGSLKGAIVGIQVKAAAAVALAAASVPAAMAIFVGAGVADADVCANVGRRISVGGCANIADAVADFVPPPAYYAPFPEDPPPPVYAPPPPPPPPNVNVCANVGRRIRVGGCV